MKKGEESEDERWWPEKRLSISDPDWMWKMNRKWRAEIPGRNKAGRKVGKGTTSLKRQELRIGKERKTPAKEEETKEWGNSWKRDDQGWWGWWEQGSWGGHSWGGHSWKRDVRDDEEWWDSRPPRDESRSHSRRRRRSSSSSNSKSRGCSSSSSNKSRGCSPLPKGPPSRSPSPLKKGNKVWRKKEQERQSWHDMSQPSMEAIPEEKEVEEDKKEKEKEASSSSSSSGTLAKGKIRVMVDFHNTLEIGEVIPAINEAAIMALIDAGCEVAVCSWCFPNRQQKVMKQLMEHSFYRKLWRVLFTQERTNHPSCKGCLCLRDGMVALFDDSADILSDALEKGIDIYPITTRREKHQWYADKGFTEGPWSSFAEAVHSFLTKTGRLR